MTHVVPMHCGDPLGEQQTITNKQKKRSDVLRNISSQSFVIELIMLWFNFFPWLGFQFPLF